MKRFIQIILIVCINLGYVYSKEKQPLILQSTYFQTNNFLNFNGAKTTFDTSTQSNISENFINVGLIKNYLWIHYKIQTHSSNDENFMILDNSRLNKITAYFQSSDIILDSLTTGDFYPFTSRKLLYPNFRFRIPASKDSIIDVYFFIDHRGSTLQLPIKLVSKETFIDHDRKSLLLVGLKMGLFIIPLFFGFSLFLTTKNKTYLLYSLYVFISATWLWSTDGYGFQYMWQSYPQMNNRVEASFGVLYSGIFTAYALQFTKQYHTEKSFFRNILKWLMWFFFCWGIIPLFPFISIEYTSATPIFLYAFFTLNILAAFVILKYLTALVNKNGKPILFFLLAVANTIIFSVLVVLYNLGYINLHSSSSTLVGIGMIIDIVFITLGLAYQFNQYRLDKEKILIEYVEQQKSMNAKILATQEEERIRISREMHDDIGAGLTHITLMSEAAKSKNNNEPELNNIAIIGRKLVSSLSEIIWSLQPQNNNLEQLFNYLREHLNELLEYSNIDYKISLPEHFTNKNISSSVSRNIILVCKEVVNNAVKYSHATEIHIVATIVKNNIEFIITDNGIGFDANTNKSGNGLRNIHFRSKEMNSNLRIESSNEKGTVIYFDVEI